MVACDLVHAGVLERAKLIHVNDGEAYQLHFTPAVQEGWIVSRLVTLHGNHILPVP
jgi:hypothetical protein